MKIQIKENVTLLLLGVSLILFFVLNYLTVFAFDDFNYAFQYTAQGLSDHRIHSLTDIFTSQYHHYFWQNGRVVVHFFVQLFRLSDSKIWFDVCNTIVFGLFQIGVFKLLRQDIRTAKTSDYLFFLLIVWFLLPGPNHALLWLSGSINYLWASTSAIYLLILNNYILTNQNKSAMVLIGLFLLSFLMNATHEVIAIPLTFILLYQLVSKGLKSGAAWSVFCGASLGALFIAIAPANFHRLTEAASGGGNIGDTITTVENYRFLSVKMFIVLGIVIFIFGWMNRKSIISKLKVVAPSLIFIFISLLLVITSHSISQRAMFPAAVFAMIAILTFLFSLDSRNKKSIYKLFAVGMCLCALFEYAHVVKDLRINRDAYVQQSNEIRSAEPKISVFSAFEYRRNRFVSTGVGNQSPLYYVNQGMSRTYRKPILSFLPKSEFLMLNRLKFDSIRYVSRYRCVLIPLRSTLEAIKLQSTRVQMTSELSNTSNTKKYYPITGTTAQGSFLLIYVKSNFSFSKLKSISILNSDNQLIQKYNL